MNSYPIGPSPSSQADVFVSLLELSMEESWQGFIWKLEKGK
jgi:hypothetical protein